MTLSDEEIRNNYFQILERIEKAAKSVSRSAQGVHLIAVSKKQPIDALVSAAHIGIKIFGENYAEEVPPKQAALIAFEGIQWHMIGHIQSRKVKTVVETIDFVHSIDSLDIALRLDRNLRELGRTLPILLEMNVSSEASKGGWAAWDQSLWEKLSPEIEAVLGCSNLRLCGLMTMPPLFDDPETTRPYFLRLAKLRDFFAHKYPSANWSNLSMGTSADFEVAVQEGATMVRIGQAIFGPRPPRENS